MSHDRRLDDPAYGKYPYLAILKFGYEMFADSVDAATAFAGLLTTPRKQSINVLAASAINAAFSPANLLVGNVDAQREAWRSGGRSLFRGAGNFAHALRNGGLPDLVDAASFQVGRNLAVTPGVVVHREELFELLRYAPATKQVHDVPLLIVPPPINRYYILDLAPGRSLVESVVAAGHTCYMISWINPGAELADVSFADYVTKGTLAALDFIGAPKVNLAGLCLGGTLATMTAAYDTASGRHQVNSLTLIVALTDFSGDVGAMGAMIDRKAVKDMRTKTAKTGFLSAEEMGAGFRYLKPADLIWGPAAKQWLLGEDPPVSALLAWNLDGTRLPARMHNQYLEDCYLENQLATGRMVIGGVTLNMGDMQMPLYVVAAQDDHIVPWFSSLRGASLTGGPRRLIVTRGGHIGGIVAVSKQAWYMVGDDTCLERTWLVTARKHDGCWWDDWAKWAETRSGAMTAPPVEADNLGAAPGEYVFA